jgi:hypothetical protein
MRILVKFLSPQPQSCIYLVHDTNNKGFSWLSLARLCLVLRKEYNEVRSKAFLICVPCQSL